MVCIDKGFTDKEIGILKSLVGKKLIAFHHDEFHFTNSSSQLVCIESEAGTTYLYSLTEPLDYYGSVEDVAIWTISDERYKFVDKKQLISSFVNETVNKIYVIQENQRLFESGQQTYDVWITRGIIFDFSKHQFSFEKPIWFSEDIYIRKGYKLINEFAGTDKFVNDDWSEGCTAECERHVITLA